MTKRDKTILIDGAKLKDLLESKTGKTIRELSLENGYSDSFLRMSCKTGKASPSVVTLAKLYGIEPDEYELKPVVPVEDETDSKQMSFDEISNFTEADKALIKDIVKEAIREAFTKLECNKMQVTYDDMRQRYIATLFIRKEFIEGA